MSISTEHGRRRPAAIAFASLVACADAADDGGASATDETSTSTATGGASTTNEATTGTAPTTTDTATDASTDESSSTGENPWCVQQDGRGAPPERILLVVDASASMLEPVDDGEPGPKPVPWEAMLSAVGELTACLEGDPQARAQFGLRLLPGPVGDASCDRSSALDLEGWVSADEVMTRLASVQPQGARAMRRTLEELPTDADLVVLLSHGAPACGDDVDPDVLDTEVVSTVTAQGVSVTIGHVALPADPTPVEDDLEPDGVDAHDELLAIGSAIETTCLVHLPLFAAEAACPNLIECLYGSRLDPCATIIAPPMNGELDEVLFWIGDDPIPRVDACAAEPAWQFAGPWLDSSDWVIRFCTDALCRRRWDEGLSLQHSCNPDGPG